MIPEELTENIKTLHKPKIRTSIFTRRDFFKRKERGRGRRRKRKKTIPIIHQAHKTLVKSVK